MLFYKLAKKLKNAGFSQKQKREYMDSEVGNAITFDKSTEGHFDAEHDFLYIPTLSELIKSCGDHEYFLLEKIPKGWIACCCKKNPICVKDFLKLLKKQFVIFG